MVRNRLVNCIKRMNGHSNGGKYVKQKVLKWVQNDSFHGEKPTKRTEIEFRMFEMGLIAMTECAKI